MASQLDKIIAKIHELSNILGYKQVSYRFTSTIEKGNNESYTLFIHNNGFTFMKHSNSNYYLNNEDILKIHNFDIIRNFINFHIKTIKREKEKT